MVNVDIFIKNNSATNTFKVPLVTENRVKMSTLHLKDLPSDVKKYILKVQGEVKAKKGIAQYSQQSTICQIVREHKEFTEKKG